MASSVRIGVSVDLGAFGCVIIGVGVTVGLGACEGGATLSSSASDLGQIPSLTQGLLTHLLIRARWMELLRQGRDRLGTLSRKACLNQHGVRRGDPQGHCTRMRRTTRSC